MSMSYQQLFDICVRAVKAGRNGDPREKFCNCGSKVLERGCHVDALLGERARIYPDEPLCTGCLTAPAVGVREHRSGTGVALALVDLGVPPTSVSADILDHFAFIHDLAGDDWRSCIFDCVENVKRRHRITLNVDVLDEKVVH